jgi:hypothetical protein
LSLGSEANVLPGDGETGEVLLALVAVVRAAGPGAGEAWSVVSAIPERGEDAI